jgi:hypothetical protein
MNKNKGEHNPQREYTCWKNTPVAKGQSNKAYYVGIRLYNSLELRQGTYVPCNKRERPNGVKRGSVFGLLLVDLLPKTFGNEGIPVGHVP